MATNQFLKENRKKKEIQILDRIDLNLSKICMLSERSFEERYQAMLQNTQLKLKLGLI